MNSAKETYITKLPANLPLFHHPWWLNCVCDSNWDVCIVYEDSKVVASMPYHVKTIKNKRYITMPVLTPFLGPFIEKNIFKNSTKIKHDVRLLESLMEQLPEFRSFRQKWHYDYKNWLPFYWQGFSQTTRYSYIIDKSNPDEVWVEFKDSIRKSIVKAQKILKIDSSPDLNTGFALVSDTYQKQQLLPPYSLDFFKKFYAAINENKAGEKYFAMMGDKPIAVMILVWDNDSIYPIISGVNDENKNTGAISLLLWHGVQLAISSGKKFDFEGSMIKPIELFFRGFNGDQKTFFEISKENTNRIDFLKDSVRNFKRFLFPAK